MHAGCNKKYAADIKQYIPKSLQTRSYGKIMNLAKDSTKIIICHMWNNISRSLSRRIPIEALFLVHKE